MPSRIFPASAAEPAGRGADRGGHGRGAGDDVEQDGAGDGGEQAGEVKHAERVAGQGMVEIRDERDADRLGEPADDLLEQGGDQVQDVRRYVLGEFHEVVGQVLERRHQVRQGGAQQGLGIGEGVRDRLDRLLDLPGEVLEVIVEDRGDCGEEILEGLSDRRGIEGCAERAHGTSAARVADGVLVDFLVHPGALVGVVVAAGVVDRAGVVVAVLLRLHGLSGGALGSAAHRGGGGTGQPAQRRGEVRAALLLDPGGQPVEDARIVRVGRG